MIEHKTEIGRICCDDYYKISKEYPDNYFDLIVTDPPWNTTGLDFDKEEFDFHKMCTEMYRVLKDNGWFFLFCPAEIIVMAFQCGFKRKFEYIWLKTNIIPKAHNTIRPFYMHELIFAFVKSHVKPSALYMDNEFLSEEGKAYFRSGHTIKTTSFHEGFRVFQKDENGRFVKTESNNIGTRVPTSVLRFPNKCSLSKDERTDHPTQKPLGLIEKIIGGYCPKEGIVFEPFLGSGTAVLACEKLGRKYVCSEIDQMWYDKAIERLVKFNVNLDIEDLEKIDKKNGQRLLF